MFGALTVMKQTFPGKEVPETMYRESEADVEYLIKQIGIFSIAIRNALA
jgi:hypothetical protein